MFILQHDGKEDFVKIVDFGIAKAASTGTGAPAPPAEGQAAKSESETLVSPAEAAELTAATGGMVGTPAYVSPEQAQEMPVDARTDQYSLGCMLFEMLTGERPYKDETKFGLLMKHIQEPVPKIRERCPAAKVPEPLDLLVQRLMAKQPAQRFPSMREVAEALERQGSQSRLPRWGLPVIGAVLLLLLCSSSYLGYRVYRQAHDGKPRLRPGEFAQAQQSARTLLQDELKSDKVEQRLHAIAAFGQVHDLSQRATLEALLGSTDNVVAGQAAEALGQLGDRESAGALAKLLAQSSNAAVRLAAAHALLLTGDPQGESYLERSLTDGDAETRIRAAFLLCDRNHPKVRPLLLSAVSRGGLPESLSLNILGCLAGGKDGNDAREQLKSMLLRAASPRQQIPVAARLAQLGDPDARKLLRELGQRPGPERLLAARALASPDEPTTVGLFRKVLKDGHADQSAARLLATEGLGLSGEPFDVRQLVSELQDADNEPALRQAAAVAILQIAANDPSSLSIQSISWAHGAFAASDWAVRESAAEVLGDCESADAVRMLAQMLSDSEVEVRRTSVRALGRRVEREALMALQKSLHDSDGNVRREALRSIGRVALLLIQRGDTSLGQVVAGWLKDEQKVADARERILASTILVKLGDDSQRETLRSFEQVADADVRRFLIEESDAAEEFLLASLKDSSFPVRFAAARKLAEKGDRRALPVLKEAIDRGGAFGITAYGLLNQLGEKVDQPEALAAAINPQIPSSQRIAAIEAIGRMPADLAVPLLLQAARDREGLVRRLVAEVAADLPMGAQGAPGVPVLRLLTADSDPAVRARAAVLLSRLATTVEQSAASAAKPEAASARGADGGAAAVAPPHDGGATAPVDSGSPAAAEGTPDGGEAPVGRGSLLITAPEGVQFQIDRHAWQGVSGKPIPLSAGPHHLTSMLGTQDFVIEDKKTLTVTLEESPVEKTLDNGLEAYRKKEYGKAQKYFERAASQCAGDHKHAQACANITVELATQRGQLFEQEKRWPEAMMEYQKLLSPENKTRAKAVDKVEAQEAVARLSPRLGQIIIQRMDNGHCKEESLWLLPGTQSVKVDGKRQTVNVRPRDVLRLGECQ